MGSKIYKQVLLAMLLLCSVAMSAQISGTVTDAETGEGLIGANILIKGTSTGTVTDFDGNYTLEGVEAGSVLVFSYTGYSDQEINYDGTNNVIDLQMSAGENLDEVVVIGYGTTTVKDATGSVVALTSEDFNQGVITSPEQLIQGKTAGVQITQNSGAPGAGVEVRIRGSNSIRSNNNPLFVVDGIPLSGENISAEGVNVGFGSSGSTNPLANLNPNDIESMSILKDASATAIYGSRGANGVVIITTKSGRKGGGGSWDLSSSLSIASPAKDFDVMDADQFITESERLGFQGRDFRTNPQESGTDWQDVVTRTAVSHNHNLGYSLNYGSGNVRASFGYGDQQGVLEKSNLERLSGRLNITQRFIDNKLRLQLQGSISTINTEDPPIGGNAGASGDVLGASYAGNPTWPNDPDFDNTGGNVNPANALAYTESLGETTRGLINFSANYDFTSRFSTKLNLGYDVSDSERTGVASSQTVAFAQGTDGNGSGALSILDANSFLIEATANYKIDFSNSKLDLLGGYSFQDFTREGRDVSAWGFSTTSLSGMVDDIRAVSDAIEGSLSGSYQQYGYAGNTNGLFVNRLYPNITTDRNLALPSNSANIRSIFANTFDFTDELQSYFGRVNYTIADKYLFTATFRADGSSRFAEDNRYGYFPSAAAAWRIDQEDFLGEAFSTLKLRASWGITGNQDGIGYGNYIRRERFSAGGTIADVIDDGGNINIPGVTAVAFAEPDLKWEETTQYSLGVDFGFDNERLTGSIDLYRSETKDLLFRIFSAQPAVQDFLFLNLPGSKVVNEGIELAIGYDFVNTKDWYFGADFNVTYNDNVIESLDGEYNAGQIFGQGLSNAFAQKLQEGQPIFSYFLRDFQGFDSEGQPIQEDIQRFIGKSALPEVFGGLSTNVNYKNWSLAAYFAGQFGHYIYNNTANAFFTAGSFNSGRNVPQEVIASGEAFSAAADVSTRFLEKGDFIRLQNLSLGYSVPLSENSFLNSFRVSATAQNLFVITDYTGLDPEVSTSPSGGDLLNGFPVFGIDYTSFPRPRTYTFAINISF